MLGKATKPAAPAVETQAKIGTIIGPGAVFDGNLTAPETIRLDGTINGNLSCEKNLILGPEGQIKGNITAQNVVISGKVEGDIVVRGKLELFSTGRVSGNITARSLVIDEDAYFDGRCNMTTSAGEMKASPEQASKAEKTPAPKLEAPAKEEDEDKY